MRHIMLAPMIVLAACAGLPRQRPAVADAPVFSATRFFAGRTEGVGTLRIIARSASPTLVAGSGRVEADGTLVLAQTVCQGAKPPIRREWRIREVSPRRYAGTLTDAIGPIAGEVAGNRLQLRFRMKGGLDAEQQLYLAADGASAHNYMTISKLGIVVATLDETIHKLP